MKLLRIVFLFLFSVMLSAQTVREFSGAEEKTLTEDQVSLGNDFPVIGFQYNVFPAEFYSGDTVHLFCTFVSTAGLVGSPLEEGSFDEPFYEDHNLVIYTVSLGEQEGTYSLNLVFKAWHPGILEIPILKTGPFEILLPQLKVLSAIDEEPDTGIQPLRPPKLLPGTDYYILGAVSAGVVLILLLIALAIVGIKGLPYFSKKHTIRKRFKILRKKLNRLEKQKERISKEEYFAVISRELRLFMERKFTFSFTSLCTDDIEKYLYFNDSNLTKEIREVFSSIDFIRYGKQQPENVLENTRWGRFLKDKKPAKAVSYILDLAQRMEYAEIREDNLK